VQPVLVSREPYHLDCRKPFGRIWSRIAERRQLAHGHQNLNVMLREARQFRRRRNIKACRAERLAAIPATSQRLPSKPGSQADAHTHRDAASNRKSWCLSKHHAGGLSWKLFGRHDRRFFPADACN